MKESKVKIDCSNKRTGDKEWNVCEFDSLAEFYDYICNTPLNESFRWESLSSNKSNYSFSQTHNFNEASKLFKNGWDSGAEELTKQMKVKTHTSIDVEYKNFLSVAGYQAIVPLYLNGVPNNMVNKRLTPVKKKVITINKAICASACVSAETMKTEAIKCFQIIKKIEQSGVRVNLNLLISTGHVCAKIPLKKSTEKINVSKMAFPLVHPAMFRRLYFRFIETYPTIPKSFVYGYGKVPTDDEFKCVCKKDEILLPTLLYGHDESEIEKLSVDELIKRLA